MINIFNKFRKKKVIEGYQFAGHTFTVLDPSKMSVHRQRVLHSTSHERDLGLTTEDFTKALTTISEGLKAPKEYKHLKELVGIQQDTLADARAAVDDIIFLTQNDHQYKPFIRSGAIFILIDGEKDKDDPHGKYYDLKVELCNRHREIEDFFLRVSVGFHRSTLSSFNIGELWAWFPSKAVKVVENRIMKRIQSRESLNGSPTEKD